MRFLYRHHHAAYTHTAIFTPRAGRFAFNMSFIFIRRHYALIFIYRDVDIFERAPPWLDLLMEHYIWLGDAA